MRITFVLPYAGLAGGIRVVAIYAERLQQLGHEVFIVSTPDRPPNRREWVRRTAVRWWSHLRRQGGLSHLDKVDVDHHVLDAWRPLTNADVPNADVIVATWWETAEWIAALSPSKGAKAYFVQHYEVHPGQPVDRVKATWRLPMHKIAVAQWLVDLAAEEYGDENVSLAPNAVDLELFDAPPRDKQPRPTIGMMYSPKSFKGCDISIDAFKQAAASVNELQLVTFGATRPTKTLPLPANATFTCRPRQHEVAKFYAACDAWLVGSRSEGFGLPILEAMACRTPVIGTPTGAAPELLTDGAGFLVNAEDSQDMARAIQRFCDMPNDEWRTMSDRAREIAASYSWDHATDLFVQGLERAIERGGREPARHFSDVPAGAAA